MFLTECLLFLLSFFFGEPSAKRILLGNRMIFVHAHFSENSICNEKEFRKLSKCRYVFASFFFDFHDFLDIDFRIGFFIDFWWKQAPKIDRRIVRGASPFRDLQVLKLNESMDGSHFHFFSYFKKILFLFYRKCSNTTNR